MQTMHDTAKALVALRTEEYRAGGGGLGAVLVAQRELHGVELKLVSDPGERRKVLAASLQAAKEIEKFAEARVESGMASQGELLEARLARLRAELVLLEG